MMVKPLLPSSVSGPVDIMDYATARQKLVVAQPLLSEEELCACCGLIDAAADWTRWRALSLCATPASIKAYFLSKLPSTGGWCGGGLGLSDGCVRWWAWP